MEWKRKIVMVPVMALAFLIGLWLIFGGTGLPDDVNRPVSHVINDGDNTTLGRLFDSLLVESGDKSGIFLLANGLDVFVARARLAQMAERSIDVQYYMFHQDTVGRLFIKELLNAADRGVRVRMLIDDMYGSKADKVWTALDNHPNIEARLFNPFSRKRFKPIRSLFQVGRVLHRMHSKSFTVDNRAAIVGGRNIGNEYFDADPNLAFADMDLLTIGPVVPKVSSAFDQYWNSEHAYPASSLVKPADSETMAGLRETLEKRPDHKDATAYIDALENSQLAASLRRGDVLFQWADAKIFHDTAEKSVRGEGWEKDLLISQIWPYMDAAKDELILVSPYFVPLEEGTEALCRLSRRGVKVRILTNSLASNDVSAVHAGYAPYRKELLRAGVILYELDEDIRTRMGKYFTWLPGLKKSSLHAKSMIIDRQAMFVGSMNLDQMSLRINNEIGILFNNPQIALQSAQAFDEHIGSVAFRLELHTEDKGDETLRWHIKKGGKEAVYVSEPYAGFLKKFTVKLIGLLPVKSFL